jgi:hypothetical protein
MGGDGWVGMDAFVRESNAICKTKMISTYVGSKKKREKKRKRKEISKENTYQSAARAVLEGVHVSNGRMWIEDGRDGWVSERWDAQVAPNARGNV